MSKTEKFGTGLFFTFAAAVVVLAMKSRVEDLKIEDEFDKNITEIKAETAETLHDTIYTDNKDNYLIKETTVYNLTNEHFNKLNAENADEIKKKTMYLSGKTGDTIYRLEDKDINTLKPRPWSF